MRKIEEDMLKAIDSLAGWSGGNTKVLPFEKGCGCAIYLHNNHIATVNAGSVIVSVGTLVDWPTLTTKNRLRALGVPVSTKRGRTLIGDIDVGDAWYKGVTTITYCTRSGQITQD